MLTTWDDHDYGFNDAGAELPVRYESEALFEQVWAVADDDARRSREGIYHSLAVGPLDRRVQLILLDMRFFRTEDSMLGDDQWRWLHAVLAEPAQIRVLVSSIPVLTDAAGGESWNSLPAERQRLLRRLGQTGATTILLSGDSHFGSFYRTGSVWELTSSSLNFPLPVEVQQKVEPASTRIGAVHFEENFGVLTVDWAAGDLTLELRDAAGSTIRHEKVVIEPH